MRRTRSLAGAEDPQPGSQWMIWYSDPQGQGAKKHHLAGRWPNPVQQLRGTNHLGTNKTSCMPSLVTIAFFL